ncbi:glycosyltransferase family 4 protein [Pedococcus sp. NPDC057267]|uniref:glycosyltransferase family 4 protein n=1 Tax=Pedococcus sp. NPDC057267 TaxID=3346077 RepID=UPI003643ACBE
MRVVQLLGRSTGGIGTHVVELSRDLRAVGDDVVVVTDGLTASTFGLSDALVAWPGGDGGLAGAVRSLRTIRRAAASADVLHAHGHQAGLVAVVATVGLRTPVVVSQHNAVLAGGWRRRVLDLAQRVVARRADLVTGASSDLVDEARRLGARDSRLAPVPSPRVPALSSTPPPDDPERRALARELLRDNGIDAPDGARLVLTIARIAPQKDLDTLVEATRAFVPHTVWVVVGGGDEALLARLSQAAGRDGLPVHFVGPQAEPERWLRAADVFVLTSRWEARALVVQEAMAAGVPVVATDTGGLRDLVAGAGTLVPVGDPESVARAVTAYLQDPGARLAAADAGRRRAASWDDGEQTARRWHEWYRGVLRMT